MFFCTLNNPTVSCYDNIQPKPKLVIHKSMCSKRIRVQCRNEVKHGYVFRQQGPLRNV